MTEVFYYNAKKEVQKLELYNITSAEFVNRSKASGFNFLCIVENGDLKNASPEFMRIEEEISAALLGLLVS